jgi:hypothetical protein
MMFWPWVQFYERVIPNLASDAVILSGIGNVSRIFTRLLRCTDELSTFPPLRLSNPHRLPTHPELVCVYCSPFFL